MPTLASLTNASLRPPGAIWQNAGVRSSEIAGIAGAQILRSHALGPR